MRRVGSGAGNIRHILLTGAPGVGKTTLIRELATRLADYRPAGFYTEEIRVHGARTGFRIVSLDGRQQVLSHVDHRGPARIGRYGVDVAGLDRLLTDLALARSPSRVVIIDEIGKMECLSRRFVEEVKAVLDSSRMVIATIALKGDGFIHQVKQRPDCRVITVTRDNRNELADRLAGELRGALGPPARLGA